MYHAHHARIRPLRDAELPLANSWAVGQAWNPGPSDGLVFNAADPGSLLALETAGGPVGVVSAVRMTDEFGFIGFLVLDPAYRRAPYGWMLVQAGLERMGERVIGADSEEARVRGYRRLGFDPSFRTLTWRGVAPVRPAVWAAGVACVGEVAADELDAYDARNTGHARSAVLREWMGLPGRRTLVFRREGRLCGLGTARRCHRGVRIGPLQADDPEAAGALFDALAGFAPGEPIWLDCPENNPEAARLAAERGLVATDLVVRLYRGEPPPGRPECVYGLMSFALG